MSNPSGRSLKQYDGGSRGLLGVVDFSSLGFNPVRLFWIHGVEGSEVRAKHWHRLDQQYLICIKGKLVVSRENIHGKSSVEVSQGQGLDLPTKTWIELREFSPSATVAVLSSRRYDPGDCYSDYEAFTRDCLTER